MLRNCYIPHSLILQVAIVAIVATWCYQFLPFCFRFTVYDDDDGVTVVARLERFGSLDTSINSSSSSFPLL